jgi:hypothetical protein
MNRRREPALFDLRRELLLRTAHASAADLVRMMGYAGVRQATLERLRRVLDDPDLGLGQGTFDFRFGSHGFLETLCRVVGIPESDFRPAIEAIERRLERERNAYRPWLFADTGFRRADHPGMPLCVLALMESRRRLRFPDGFVRLPLFEQVDRARQRVRDHMRETGGHLPIWGTIQRYRFFYAPDCSVELSVDGDILGERLGHEPAGASLRLGRRELDPITEID